MIIRSGLPNRVYHRLGRVKGVRRVRSRFAQNCNLSTPINVLAFESSADDTAVAIVSSDAIIHSNVVKRQNALHKQFGGIHPKSAILEHQRNLPGAVREALDEANMTMENIHGIAFTRGPGMGGCLAVACNAAKTLAAALRKPLVGVHHMQAHALTVTLTEKVPPGYPHLTLLVSGGHTMLVLVDGVTNMKILATTLDDSIGDAFDKIGSMLGLDWGEKGLGSALEQLAASTPAVSEEEPPGLNIALPDCVVGRMEFSFAGLKVSALRWIEKVAAESGGELSLASKQVIAAKFQAKAVKQLEDKLIMALKLCRAQDILPKAIVVSGGVASNSYLRQRILKVTEERRPATESPIPVYYPPPHLCTDNAAMIAWAAMPRFLAGDSDSYEIQPRPTGWSLDSLARSDPEPITVNRTRTSWGLPPQAIPKNLEGLTDWSMA